jgi:hypothetical protein
MRIRLLLVLLFIAVSNAAAVTLDLNNPNGIAALYVIDSQGVGQTYVVCTNGTGYWLPHNFMAEWRPFTPSPVPLGDVADWTPWTLYTTDGRWFFRSSIPDAWEQSGVGNGTPLSPPCFAPVGMSGKSLGDVKSLFR